MSWVRLAGCLRWLGAAAMERQEAWLSGAPPTRWPPCVVQLCHDRKAIFWQALGERCEHVGIAYVAFNIAAATVWQFTLGIHMLRPPRQPRLVTNEEAAAEGLSLRWQQQQQQQRRRRQRRPPLEKQGTVSDLLARRGAGSSGGASPCDWAPGPAEPAEGGGSGGGGARPQLELTRLASPMEPSPWGAPPLQAPPLQQPQQQHTPVLHAVPPPGNAGSQAGTSTIGTNSSDAAEGEDREEAGDEEALLGGHGGRAAAGALLGSRLGDDAAATTASAWPWSGALAWLRRMDWGATFPLATQATIAGIAVGCIGASEPSWLRRYPCQGGGDC